MKNYTQSLVLFFIIALVQVAGFAQSEEFPANYEINLNNCSDIDLKDLYQYPPRIETLPFRSNKYEIVPVFSQESIARQSHDFKFNGISEVQKSKKGIQLINKLHGLPGSYIHDIVTDPDRNVWMHIDLIGLVRFDGHNFKVFTSDEGLVSDDIIRLEEKKDGNGVWIITKKGISVFNGLVFKNWYFEDPLESSELKSTAVQGDTLWVGTEDSGLWAVFGDEIHQYGVESGLLSNHIQSIYFDKEDKLWLAHKNGGVEYLRDDRIHRFHFASKGVSPIFIGDYQNGFYIYDKETKNLKNIVADVVYETQLDIPSDKIVFEYSKEGIWFVTPKSGVYKFTANSICKYLPKSEIPDATIQSAAIVDNQLWLGSFGKGIFILRSLDFNFIDYKTEKIDELGTFYEASDSTIYFGSFNSVYVLKPESGYLKRIDIKSSQPSNSVYNITEDPEGNIWLSTLQGLFFKGDGDVFIEQEEFTKEHFEDVFDMVFDTKGNLWIATYGNGLFLRDVSGAFKQIKVDVKGEEDILDIELDQKDQLWLASSGGIFRKVGDSFRKYDLTNFPIEHSFTIFKDNQNGIWVGAKRGVAYYNGEEFKFLDKGTGLLSNNIISIAEDSKGKIWLTTEIGLNVLENYDNWEQLEINSFTYGDGLNQLDYYYNSSFFCRNDLLWLLGPSGLVILDTKDLEFNTAFDPEVDLDQVYVNEVSIDFFQLNDLSRRKAYIDEMSYQLDLDKIYIKDQSNERFSGVYSFPHTYNSFSFSFLAKQWRSNLDIEYRYRLLGLNDKWSKPTKEKTVSYWSLPGFETYTFEVQSRLKGRKWSDSKRYKFRVRGNIWLMSKGLLIFAVCLVFLIYIINRKNSADEINPKRNLKEELKDHIKIDNTVRNILEDQPKLYSNIAEHALGLAQKMKDYGEFNSRLKQLSKASDNQTIMKDLEQQLVQFSDVDELKTVFYLDFDRYYPDFEQKLKATNGDITSRELEICKFVLTGLSNPQIANILFLQPDSVKKARQRLNKKINDTELDFRAFLQVVCSEAIIE